MNSITLIKEDEKNKIEIPTYYIGDVLKCLNPDSMKELPEIVIVNEWEKDSDTFMGTILSSIALPRHKGELCEWLEKIDYKLFQGEIVLKCSNRT